MNSGIFNIGTVKKYFNAILYYREVGDYGAVCAIEIQLNALDDFAENYQF